MTTVALFALMTLFIYQTFVFWRLTDGHDFAQVGMMCVNLLAGAAEFYGFLQVIK